jgi:hypothetical protein
MLTGSPIAIDYKISESCTIHLSLHLRGGLGELTGSNSLASGAEPRMGIAAGGIILQKIYKDSFSAAEYDEEAVHRLWIHTVSSEAWEVCPLISQRT